MSDNQGMQIAILEQSCLCRSCLRAEQWFCCKVMLLMNESGLLLTSSSGTTIVVLAPGLVLCSLIFLSLSSRWRHDGGEGGSNE